jgi:nickel/cobalt transporter (NicO) family protein
MTCSASSISKPDCSRGSATRSASCSRADGLTRFLSREARIGRGLLMGLQIAIFHVLSAMVVVALADLLLRQAFGGPPAEVAGVRLASYGLIGLIGMVMLGQAARRSWLRRHGVEVSYACCDHGSGPHGHHHARSEAGARAKEGALSLGVGLVPCTGAVLILLYALANGILLAGVLLAWQSPPAWRSPWACSAC